MVDRNSDGDVRCDFQFGRFVEGSGNSLVGLAARTVSLGNGPDVSLKSIAL